MDQSLCGWSLLLTAADGGPDFPPPRLPLSERSFFLDESCTDMLHISGFARRLTQSKGSYSTWAERRAEEQKASKREKELREVKVWPCPEAVGVSVSRALTSSASGFCGSLPPSRASRHTEGSEPNMLTC